VKNGPKTSKFDKKSSKLEKISNLVLKYVKIANLPNVLNFLRNKNLTHMDGGL